MDPAAVAHEVHDHGPPKGFWRRWVFTSDHKIIGIQFLLSSLLWGLVGGGLAMMARTKIAFPDIEMGEQFYNMSFTMHASVMIFLVIIPALAGGFGNYLIPLMIGARDMAFPTLNMLSYWVMWPDDVRSPRRIRGSLTKRVRRLDLVLSRVDEEEL